MKNVYGLHQLNTHHLTASELLTLCQETLDQVSQFTKTQTGETLLRHQETQFLSSLSQFKQILEVSKQPTVVEALEGVDKRRRAAFRTLANFVKAHALVTKEPVVRAYKKLRPLIQQTQSLMMKSYEVRTAAINTLLGTLSQTAYQESVSQLNLTTYVEELAEAQTAFELVYRQRLTEQSQLIPGQTKQARKALEVSYKQVIDLISLHSNCQPDHVAYRELLLAINAIRARYRNSKLVKKEGEASAAEKSLPAS